MTTNTRPTDFNPPERSEPPMWGLPDITGIQYGIRKYNPPIRRFTGIFSLTLYSEAAEFIIRTNRSIPVQGSAPALYIGTISIQDITPIDSVSYICRVFDYKNLPASGDFFWGWAYKTDQKMPTGFVFKKPDLVRWK